MKERIIKVIGKWFIVKLENQYFDIILYSAVRKAFIIKARNALMCASNQQKGRVLHSIVSQFVSQFKKFDVCTQLHSNLLN